ncbi:hypothetical protein [Gilliamella sp. ESL0250]|uniref:hypothetical protein n=1 Tax=Gilliamella sp. ESL0250 TaxID=2705036 RepID=UPI0015810542|nr:hypothetical protein [Gilliamella sp. ESL0250]NUF49915.1 hypothetical protein [Gilliamella sp. ESL0250]
MAKIKKYELIKTIIYELSKDEHYEEFKLEIYKGDKDFRGIGYRLDSYRLKRRYDVKRFVNSDVSLFIEDFYFCYNKSEEDIINNFYIRLEKIFGSLNLL